MKIIMLFVLRMILLISLLAISSCDKWLDEDLLYKAVQACGGFDNVMVINSYYKGYLHCKDGTTKYIGN
jgi:hypothetical protein